MINELVGWKRITVGGERLPYRHNVRILSGSSSADDSENDATSLQLGKLQSISVDGVSYQPRSTLDIIGATADADDDSILVHVVPPSDWYTREVGWVDPEEQYAELSELVIPSRQGLYLLHAIFRFHDRHNPTHVGYHDGIWGVVRDSLGVLSATIPNHFGGGPMPGARENYYDISNNLFPYYVIDGSRIRFGCTFRGEISDEFQVTCDARIAVVPRNSEADMAFWTGWASKIGAAFVALIPGLSGVLMSKSDGSEDLLQSNGRGAARVAVDGVSPPITSSALESSHTIAGSSTTVKSLRCRLDSTAATGTYYVQVWDAASTILYYVEKVQHVLGVDDWIDFQVPPEGVVLAGCIVCLSSTEFTKTIGGSYLCITGVVS